MGSGYVGVVSADLHLPQGHSLKDKRRELRRLKQRLAQRHGATVAEVDHHDLWQRARVTAAVVGPDARDVGERVEAMARELGGDPAFVLLEEAREVRAVEARPTFLDVRGSA